MIREYTHIHGRRNKVLMDAHTYGVNIHGKLLFDYHAISFTAKPLAVLRMWMFSSMFKKGGEIRMEEARKILESSQLSVVDIAKKEGYEDSQYFFRVFKNIRG